MDNRRKTHITLLDQGMVSGMNFITGLLLARFLGLEGYGQFVLAYGIILFISGIQVALIISPMMVKAPTLDEEHIPGYFQSAGILQILFSLASYLTVALIGIIVNFFNPNIETYLFLAPLGIATIFFTAQDYLRRYYFVTNKPASALINDIISYCLQAILILYFGLSETLDAEKSLWLIAITSAAAVSFGLLAQGGIVKSPYTVNKRENFIRLCIDHWQFGKWLIARNITYWGGSQFTIYLSAALLSVAMVGAITATRNIIGIANILFLAMENFVPSRAAKRFKSGGYASLQKYITRVSLLGGSLTASIVLVAVIAPEFWLNLIYGDEYQGYGALVYWWSAYYLIGFFHKPISAGLRTLNMTKEIFYATVAGTAVALIASYPMIIYIGITGAMVTMLGVQAIMLVVLLYFLTKHTMTQQS